VDSELTLLYRAAVSGTDGVFVFHSGGEGGPDTHQASAELSAAVTADPTLVHRAEIQKAAAATRGQTIDLR